MTRLVLVMALAGALMPAAVMAQPQSPSCAFICELEWKVEPTFTIDNLANRHRVRTADGVSRVDREHVFETVFALDMETRIPRLGFTFEAITSPFQDDNGVDLEFETNLHWLEESATGGWLSSHFDIVDKLSPAERPTSRSYTHKLDLELDTALHLFNFLPDGRWLKGLELETSLDYLATGLPRRGDVSEDGTVFLDNASRWSLSFVIVIPIAPR